MSTDHVRIRKLYIEYSTYRPIFDHAPTVLCPREVAHSRMRRITASGKWPIRYYCSKCDEIWEIQ